MSGAARPAGGKKKIRVGLIGNDGHVGIILRSIPRLENVFLAAFAKSRPGDDVSWLRRQPAFTKDTVIYDDYNRMLEEQELDVVGVCLPYYRNAEASIKAARRGINIVSEKPVATTLADLVALEAAVKQSGVRLSAMMNMRTGPPYQAARRAVEKGWIGEPILLYAQKSYKFGRTRPWFYKERETYGGTIPWVGIHAIDYMRWTSGQEYTRVAAHHGNKAHPGYPGCEDHAGVLFELANGGTAVCNLDYLRPEAAATHGDDRLRIAGSEGVIEVVGTKGKAYMVTANRDMRELDLPPPVDFFGSFVAELRGEGEHIIRPGEAVLLTRICLKARQAADAGKWVEL